MSVMVCNRKNCNNIMCDTYVTSIGYICYDCQQEFKEYLTNNNMSPLTEGDIAKCLNEFMNTSKSHYEKGDDISIEDFFSRYTRK